MSSKVGIGRRTVLAAETLTTEDEHGTVRVESDFRTKVSLFGVAKYVGSFAHRSRDIEVGKLSTTRKCRRT
jgi:hypothetical protein